MHVWLAFAFGRRSYLLDLAAGEFPDAATVMGWPWPGPKPPAYFFHEAGQPLPRGVTYRPDRDACRLAARALAVAAGQVPWRGHAVHVRL
jgi:hypothetical protein